MLPAAPALEAAGSPSEPLFIKSAAGTTAGAKAARGPRPQGPPDLCDECRAVQSPDHFCGEARGIAASSRAWAAANSGRCAGTQRTLEGLSDMFRSARSIMKWLGDCAALVGKQEQPVQWVTPLGLPVVQPYRCCRGPPSADTAPLGTPDCSL